MLLHRRGADFRDAHRERRSGGLGRRLVIGGGAAASGDQDRDGEDQREGAQCPDVWIDQSLSSAVKQRAFRGGLARGEVLLDVG